MGDFLVGSAHQIVCVREPRPEQSLELLVAPMYRLRSAMSDAYQLPLDCAHRPHISFFVCSGRRGQRFVSISGHELYSLFCAITSHTPPDRSRAALATCEHQAATELEDRWTTRSPRLCSCRRQLPVLRAYNANGALQGRPALTVPPIAPRIFRVRNEVPQPRR